MEISQSDLKFILDQTRESSDKIRDVEVRNTELARDITELNRELEAIQQEIERKNEEICALRATLAERDALIAQQSQQLSMAAAQNLGLVVTNLLNKGGYVVSLDKVCRELKVMALCNQHNIIYPLVDVLRRTNYAPMTEDVDNRLLSLIPEYHGTPVTTNNFYSGVDQVNIDSKDIKHE